MPASDSTAAGRVLGCLTPAATLGDRRGDTEIRRAIARTGPGPVRVHANRRQTAFEHQYLGPYRAFLHECCRYPLLEGGANSDAKDGTGRIPLLLVDRTRHPGAHDVLLAHMRTIPNPEFLLTAAANDDFDTVISLLRVNTDPNATDRNGWGSLHWAVYRGHTEATAALLGAGADPNVKNNAGQTAIDVAKMALANRDAIIAILHRETGR